MSLGISSFSEAPISALASTNVILSLTGEELTITAGNIGIGAGVGASITGEELTITAIMLLQQEALSLLLAGKN